MPATTTLLSVGVQVASIIQIAAFTSVLALPAAELAGPIGVGAVVASGIALAAVRVPRIVVVLDSKGVLVRNLFRTMNVTWDRVEAVTVASLPPFALNAVAFRARDRRRPVPAQASILARRGRERLLGTLRHRCDELGIMFDVATDAFDAEDFEWSVRRSRERKRRSGPSSK